MAFIDAHNHRYRIGEESYQTEVNQFTDRREDELKQKNGLRRRPKPNQGQVSIEALLA